MKRRCLLLLATLGLAGSASCAQPKRPPLPLVEHVDLQRFMGDWYVIANIPTRLEKQAYGAVESYRLAEDGTIATTYSHRTGSFDGPQRRFTPRGFVLDRGSNAIWGMRFIWPFKSDYRIAYVASDYSTTIVAREQRDYVWIMARTPQLAAAEYESLVQKVATLGYDTTLLRKVPQR